jgi:hypothetical protein
MVRTNGKLVISAIGQKTNSILTSSYTVVDDRVVPCVSLVDSPQATPASEKQYYTTVEDADDEGEPDDREAVS